MNIIRICICAISPLKNIFGSSFVNFWTTQYIWIFVCKFIKNQISLNICSEPYSKICPSFLMKIVNLDKIYALIISCITFFFRKHEWVIFKNFFDPWWIWIFEYSNKITLQYYSYSYSCYFWRTNILGYSFDKYVASK